MTRITVLGGAGFTGANIAKEAVARGHQVTSLSRSLPKAPLDGVQYMTGSVLDPTDRLRAAEGAEVVIGALSSKGGLGDQVVEAYRGAAEAAQRGVRLGVIGGYSSLRSAPGAPRISESRDLPERFAAEARSSVAVIDHLQAEAPEGLDWFFLSPAAVYGTFAPGEPTGAYRVSDDVAISGDGGPSTISGADFATAVLDEIETPTHHSVHFSVAH